MTTKHLYLHIGVRKTASTAIQYGLEQNETQLQQQGYYCPKSARSGHGGIAYHNLVADMATNNEADTHPTLAALCAELQREDYPNFIISAEGLERLKPHKVRLLYDQLSQHAHITVIIYLRRQDKLVQSFWSQVTKIGCYYPYFLDDPLALVRDRKDTIGDYAGILARWAPVVGKQNIRVRLFDEIIAQKEDVFTDFLKTCDVPNLEPFTQPDYVNTSPSAKTLAVIRAIAAKMQPEHTRPGMVWRTALWEGVHTYADEHGWNDERFNLLTPEVSRQIMDYYAESNAEVARAYFGREQLFDESFPPKPTHTFDINTLPQDDLLAVAAAMGDAFVEEVSHWRERHNRQSPRRAQPDHHITQEYEALKRYVESIEATRAWQAVQAYWRLRDRVKGWLGRS